MTQLPQSLGDDWLVDLLSKLPQVEVVSTHLAVNFLDHAVDLAKRSPDGSVLKYAIKSLVGKFPHLTSESAIARYALHLAFHQPVLVPLLERFLDARTFPSPPQRFSNSLKSLALENARLRRTDATSWLLHFQNKYSIEVEDETAKEVLESRDCVPMLLLYLSGNPTHQSLVINSANRLGTNDPYELDQYWLLRYQLYLDGHISNIDPEEARTFKVLADASVSFVAPPP